MQLPFAVTLSSILSENEKVLLLDLQENSGLSQLMGEFYSSGMEELLVMAEAENTQRAGWFPASVIWTGQMLCILWEIPSVCVK